MRAPVSFLGGGDLCFTSGGPVSDILIRCPGEPLFGLGSPPKKSSFSHCPTSSIHCVPLDAKNFTGGDREMLG